MIWLIVFLVTIGFAVEVIRDPVGLLITTTLTVLMVALFVYTVMPYKTVEKFPSEYIQKPLKISLDNTNSVTKECRYLGNKVLFVFGGMECRLHETVNLIKEDTK